MTEKSFFAGFGGQGIISLGEIWVYFGMLEGKNVTCFPYYGAEKRGGIARAGVIISDEEIASPLVPAADSVLVMNSASLSLCEGLVKKGGLMLINAPFVKEEPARSDIKIAKIDATGIAEKLGSAMFSNMVALGALARLTGVLKLDDVEGVFRKFFKDKQSVVPKNVEAVKAGYSAC